MYYAVLDTETGGLNSQTCSLLEFSVIIADSRNDFNIVDQLTMRCKPNDGIFKVNAAALEVNGIDLKTHVQGAYTYAQAEQILVNFAFAYAELNRKKLVPVGWNIDFDLRFIHEYICAKTTWEEFFTYRTLDVQDVVRYKQLIGEVPADVGSMSSARRWLGIPTDKEHTANSDAFVTLQILKALCKKDSR